MRLNQASDTFGALRVPGFVVGLPPEPRSAGANTRDNMSMESPLSRAAFFSANVDMDISIV